MAPESVTVIVDTGIDDLRRTFWPSRTLDAIGICIWVLFITKSGIDLIQGIDSPDRGLILPAFLIIGGAFILRKTVREWLEKRDLIAEETKALGDRTFRFDKSGIIVAKGESSNSFDWPEFIRVLETKYDFFFYTDSRTRWGIPKRCFESEDQVNRFKQLISENLGSVAVLRH